MKKEDIFCKLFGFSKNTYYLWKRENKPVIQLINMYLKDEDLIEFIENKKIEKFTLIKNFNNNQKDLTNKIKSIIKNLIKKENDVFKKLDVEPNSIDAIPYVNNFIKYILSTNELNIKTYAEYILKIQLDSIKNDTREQYDEIINNNNLTAAKENILIFKDFNLELFLQLKILINDDFINILKYSTKNEIENYWIDFWVTWINFKYKNIRKKDIYKAINEKENIKEINFKNLLEEIKKNIK